MLTIFIAYRSRGAGQQIAEQGTEQGEEAAAEQDRASGVEHIGPEDMSRITQIIVFLFSLFLCKVVEVVGGGAVIIGAYPV